MGQGVPPMGRGSLYMGGGLSPLPPRCCGADAVL